MAKFGLAFWKGFIADLDLLWLADSVLFIFTHYNIIYNEITMKTNNNKQQHIVYFLYSNKNILLYCARLSNFLEN